jgi:hypothetical protein
MNTPGIERLRTLYAVLHGIPGDRLDLNTWRESLDGSSCVSDDQLLKPKSCGTMACAVGWACAYPEFQEQGLSYFAAEGCPAYGGVQSWEAVCYFFDLAENETEYLFHPNEYSPPWIKLNEWDGLEISTRSCNESDRQAALRRIRTYLVHQGAITQARSDELAATE